MAAEYSPEVLVLTYTAAVCGKSDDHNMKSYSLKKPYNLYCDVLLSNYISCRPFKYEAQTALFKDPVRTAQENTFHLGYKN